MKTQDSTLLQANTGQIEIINQHEESITIIQTNYLKNIQSDLMEERAAEEAKPNNEIVYVRVELQGVLTEMMINTGANISLIDKTELNRIQESSTERIPTLPIHNITIIGATGRQNKTVKQQVILNVTSKGIGIPMGFIVAQGLPFKVLLGCDMLRCHSAIL